MLRATVNACYMILQLLLAHFYLAQSLLLCQQQPVQSALPGRVLQCCA